MNLLLLHSRLPEAAKRLSSRAGMIGRRLAAPPRNLLKAAEQYPASWGKRLVDLNRGSVTDADLDWSDWTLVDDGPLRHRCWEKRQRGRIGWVDVVRDVPHGRLDRPATPVLPRWDLATLDQYSVVMIPLFEPAAAPTGGGTVYARRSTADVLEEINRLHELGWSGDVCLVTPIDGSAPWFSDELLEGLSSLRAKASCLTFSAEAGSTEILASDTALRMADAGFTNLFLRFRLGGLQDDMPTDEREFVGSLKRLQRAGLQIRGGMAVSEPHADVGRLAETVRRLWKSGVCPALGHLVRAPVGARSCLAATQSMFSARGALWEIVRSAHRAARSGSYRPAFVAIAYTVAVHSELLRHTERLL